MRQEANAMTQRTEESGELVELINYKIRATI